MVVMGIISMLWIMVLIIGLILIGVLVYINKFWVVFVMGGVLWFVYDFGLWVMFINMKLYEYEEGGDE